jgi:hypothetical protein
LGESVEPLHSGEPVVSPDAGESRRAVDAELATLKATLAEERERAAARALELERELEALRARLAEPADAKHRRLAGEVVRLKHELEAVEQKRIRREEEWLAYTRAVSSLELKSLPEELEFQSEVEAPEEEAVAVSPETAAAAERGAEVLNSLRTLLTIEEVVGLDLLEAGTLGDGWTGPVVFRVLDGDGRLAGSLWAERLRLEGSRAARTLTLVLEEGYETNRGTRIDFDAPDPRAPGVRRIVLPRVDPLPWVEALPELFAKLQLDEPIDDGRWNLTLVRGRLNELLREDAAGGWYRMKALGGVRANVLRTVHVERLDREGRVERHLFADRLTIAAEEKGVLLLFEDGAQVRGHEKAAFLEGRYRVYLPRAVVEEWAEAGIPGLAEPPPVRSAATTGG